MTSNATDKCNSPQNFIPVARRFAMPPYDYRDVSRDRSISDSWFLVWDLALFITKLYILWLVSVCSLILYGLYFEHDLSIRIILYGISESDWQYTLTMYVSTLLIAYLGVVARYGYDLVVYLIRNNNLTPYHRQRSPRSILLQTN